MGDGPPGFRRNSSCSAVLRIHSGGDPVSATGLLPALADRSRSIHLPDLLVTPKECPTTPESKLSGLGWFRFARRYSGNRVCFLFLRVLRCFSSPGLPPGTYGFSAGYGPITDRGFPHSEIFGSQPTYGSPKHIGVSPVLLRLLVPRHPPCALLHFTIRVKRRLTFDVVECLVSYLVFKVHGLKDPLISQN